MRLGEIPARQRSQRFAELLPIAHRTAELFASVQQRTEQQQVEEIADDVGRSVHFADAQLRSTPSQESPESLLCDVAEPSPVGAGTFGMLTRIQIGRPQDVSKCRNLVVRVCRDPLKRVE